MMIHIKIWNVKFGQVSTREIFGWFWENLLQNNFEII